MGISRMNHSRRPKDTSGSCIRSPPKDLQTHHDFDHAVSLLLSDWSKSEQTDSATLPPRMKEPGLNVRSATASSSPDHVVNPPRQRLGTKAVAPQHQLTDTCLPFVGDDLKPLILKADAGLTHQNARAHPFFLGPCPLIPVFQGIAPHSGNLPHPLHVHKHENLFPIGCNSRMAMTSRPSCSTRFAHTPFPMTTRAERLPFGRYRNTITLCPTHQTAPHPQMFDILVVDRQDSLVTRTTGASRLVAASHRCLLNNRSPGSALVAHTAFWITFCPTLQTAPHPQMFCMTAVCGVKSACVADLRHSVRYNPCA
jgi:hypothetical protein